MLSYQQTETEGPGIHLVVSKMVFLFMYNVTFTVAILMHCIQGEAHLIVHKTKPLRRYLFLEKLFC